MNRPTLVESRWARTLLFPALYFAQGVPWGFVSVGYVVMLTDLGLDDATIGGLLGLAYLPWSFKFVAGPVLDRIPMLRAGRRRPVVMFAEFVMGTSLLGLLFVDPARDVTLTSAILFVHNACAALQDVAVDALAVDVLPEDERGRANSYMWAAKSGGIMIGGSFGTLVAGRLGWPSVFVMLVLILWAVLALAVWILERPPETAHDTPTDHLSLAALKRAFGFPTPWLAIVVGLVSPIGYALVSTPFTTLTRGELGWTDEQIATSAFVDPWVGIAGALVGGWLADRYGSRRAMATGLLAIAGLLAGFAACAPAWQSFAFTLGFAAILGFLTNLYGAASLGYFMSLCDPSVGATQFSMYMATTNLTYAWTSAAGGWISEHHGHALLFLVAGGVQVVAIASLLLADPAVARARYAAGGVERVTRYVRSFVRAGERQAVLAWLSELRPLWEQRWSTLRPPPPGETQRPLLRPVWWLGSWQFACLGYYRPPGGTRDRCVRAEPFPPPLRAWVERIGAEVRSSVAPSDVPRAWAPNTCLVNLYGERLVDGRSEDRGRVGDHRDHEPGPVASVSLGARALFQFVDRRGRVSEERWLDDGSLLIFAGPRHKEQLFHRVQRVDRKGAPLPPHLDDFVTRRVNFTFRYVPEEHILSLTQLSPESSADVAHYVDLLAERSSWWFDARKEAGWEGSG